jgi:hypothetical protein
MRVATAFVVAVAVICPAVSSAQQTEQTETGFVDCVNGAFPVLDAPAGKRVKDARCGSRISVIGFTNEWIKVRLQDGSEGYMLTGAVSKQPDKWVPFGRTLQETPTTGVAQAPLAPKYEKQGTGVAVYRHNSDRVWASIVEALTSNNLRPQTMDKASGAIFLQTDASWGSVWGSANYAVSTFTTKRVGRMSSWVGIAAQGNIYIKDLDETRTELRITMRYSGCNGFAGSFMNAQCAWEPLQTSGALEDRIIQAVADKLPAVTEADIHPVSKPDEKVISAANEVVLAVTKLATAFELNAPNDHLMSQMIDSHAAFKLYCDTGEAKVLPRFVEVIGGALETYRDALNTSGSERSTSVTAAQSKLDKAKECLNNYRTYVQEVSPKTQGK